METWQWCVTIFTGITAIDIAVRRMIDLANRLFPKSHTIDEIDEKLNGEKK